MVGGGLCSQPELVQASREGLGPGVTLRGDSAAPWWVEFLTLYLGSLEDTKGQGEGMGRGQRRDELRVQPRDR